MNIFQRTGDILAANVNDLVDRFEQPDKMLRQALRDLDASIATVQGALARSIAAQRLLSKQRDEHSAEAARWRRRASAALTRDALTRDPATCDAVTCDNDRLARRAIAQAIEADRAVTQAEEQLADSERAHDVLRLRLDALRAAQADGRRRIATWSARQAVADAQRQLQTRSLAGARGGVLTRIDVLTQRLELAEAEAIALGELQLTTSEDLSRDFADHEQDEAIEAELEHIRKTCGE